MIQILSQETFRPFGSVLRSFPECADSEIQGQLRQNKENATVYRTTAATRLHCTGGTTVLAVSSDMQVFSHFYLDKPVSIQAGIYFSLAPISQEATAELCALSLPETAGTSPRGDDYLVMRQLQVEQVCTFFYQEKERGFIFPGESHDMLELTYVDQGTVHSVADGAELTLEQGDLVLYGPNQWHMQYADMDVAPRFVTISFAAKGPGLRNLTHKKRKASQAVLGLLHQMLREQEKMDIYSGDMILALLTQLLLVLQRESDTPAEKLQTPHALHAENGIIQRAQQYISTHVRQKLSVPLVARQVDVSPSYLTALFHKHLQISPGEYIRRIKLQESKQMIRENSMNFTEIASVLQYSTVHHFSRQFKEKFGITPTEYAKSVR